MVVLQGTGNAIAQFAPLENQNQTYTQNQGASPGQYQAYAPNQSYAPNQVYTPNQVYPQNQVYRQNLNQIYSQNPRFSQPQPQPQTQQTQPQTRTQTQPQLRPQYTAMAFQPSGGQVAVPSTEAVTPTEELPTSGYGMPAAGYSAQSGPGCNTCQSDPAANYRTYDSGGGAGYNTFSNSCGYGNCETGAGLGARRGNGRRWFGGFYGLYMERVQGNRVPLGFQTMTPGTGYYPTDSEVALTTQSVDTGYLSGVEVRFGSTLGQGGVCGNGCGPVWGWEVAYWGLVEETATAQIDDMATFATDGNRTYSMIDFRGLEVNMGTGYRPVNSYFDYAPPVADHTNDTGFTGIDVEIRSLVARSTFETQSVEVNLLRLPMFAGGAYGGGCRGGGSCGIGGLRTQGGYGSFSGPRHSFTTLAGFRFMRFDEGFNLRSNVDLVSSGTTVGSQFIAYNIQAKNQLYGFQLGCNGIYRLGCRGRWALQYGSSFGIYGNRMNVSQRMDIPTTGIATRYVNGTQSNFNVNSSKDDVAFLGELRVGGSYQYSKNWRLYGGWRALAVSGVALTSSQIPTAFITPSLVGNINSDGSLILHGLQTGVEFTY